MENQTITLSLKPNDYPPRVPVVYANQYDVGRPFAAEIYDVDGSAYNFTDETVTVCGTKPSGTGFSYAATASGNTVSFTTTGQMTVVHGMVRCGLIITKGDIVVGTLAFMLYVQQAPLTAETIVDSDSFDSIIEDAIENALADAVNKTLPIDTASGSIASFADGANNALVEDLTVSIVPKQAGSGTPSPSNVRAISGFTKATIKRTGKNLIPYPYYHTTRTVTGITFTDNGDGSITINGTNTGSATAEFVCVAESQYVTAPDGAYILNGCTGGSAQTYLVQFNSTGAATVNNYSGDNNVSLSTPTNLRISVKVIAGATVNNVTVWPMLRPASITDATFEPYTADTYEVSFGSAGTVYGGTLDVTTGKLTVDRKAVLINSLTWTSGTASGRTYFKATVSDKVVMGTAQNNPLVTSNIVYGGNYTVANMPNPSICQAPNSNELRIYDSTVSTVADMLSKYGTGQMCYYLAAPIEVNLTPLDTIRTIYGVNNIWSDTGDTTVQYRADVQKYIQKMIANAMNA